MASASYPGVLSRAKNPRFMLILLAMLLGSTAGLWLFLRVAPSLDLVDQPNARSLHSTPTVVSGGLVPMTLLAAGVGSSTALPGATGIALLIAGLTAVGLLDDKWGLPSAIRLLCYLCAGIALPWLLSSDLPLGTTTLLLTGVAVAWCINLVNFMDGADGLATVQALCVATGLGLIASFGAAPNAILAWLCALLLACCAPLLGFNWPPAKLFMGDAGAVPLGFFLAVLGLLAFATDMSVGLAWLILMMPFLVDTGMTLCIRSLAGRPPHVAHRDHAYQRLSLVAGSPLPITLGVLGMQVAWQFPLAVTAVSSEVFPLLLVLLSAIPAVMAVVYARFRA